MNEEVRRDEMGVGWEEGGWICEIKSMGGRRRGRDGHVK